MAITAKRKVALLAVFCLTYGVLAQSIIFVRLRDDASGHAVMFREPFLIPIALKPFEVRIFEWTR